ncbi:MAG TPA: hypothetical protein VFJ82_00260 [Longimicrobium sp.]|nr:hypothetical protein [Longimicrobium sp.]
MTGNRSLVRRLALLALVVAAAPLTTPTRALAEDFCASDYIDGWSCAGCRIGNCWAAVCTNGVDEVSDGGCSPAPPRPQYA